MRLTPTVVALLALTVLGASGAHASILETLTSLHYQADGTGDGDAADRCADADRALPGGSAGPAPAPNPGLPNEDDRHGVLVPVDDPADYYWFEATQGQRVVIALKPRNLAGEVPNPDLWVWQSDCSTLVGASLHLPGGESVTFQAPYSGPYKVGVTDGLTPDVLGALGVDVARLFGPSSNLVGPQTRDCHYICKGSSGLVGYVLTASAW